VPLCRVGRRHSRPMFFSRTSISPLFGSSRRCRCLSPEHPEPPATSLGPPRQLESGLEPARYVLVNWPRGPARAETVYWQLPYQPLVIPPAGVLLAGRDHQVGRLVRYAFAGAVRVVTRAPLFPQPPPPRVRWDHLPASGAAPPGSVEAVGPRERKVSPRSRPVRRTPLCGPAGRACRRQRGTANHPTRTPPPPPIVTPPWCGFGGAACVHRVRPHLVEAVRGVLYPVAPGKKE